MCMHETAEERIQTLLKSFYVCMRHTKYFKMSLVACTLSIANEKRLSWLYILVKFELDLKMYTEVRIYLLEAYTFAKITEMFEQSIYYSLN